SRSACAPLFRAARPIAARSTAIPAPSAAPSRAAAAPTTGTAQCRAAAAQSGTGSLSVQLPPSPRTATSARPSSVVHQSTFGIRHDARQRAGFQVGAGQVQLDREHLRVVPYL